MNVEHAVEGVGHTLGPRRAKALNTVDSLSPELRACVHEYGLPIVTVLMKHGISSPKKIREIVREIWSGARQTGQTSGAQGTLDWLLMQAGSGISAKTLHRVLADNSLMICPVEPTKAMIKASMETVRNHNIICTHEEKHRRRLKAALTAAKEANLK